MTYIYTLIFMAFGICIITAAILAGVDTYNKRRTRRMNFVQLHRIRMKGLR